MKPQIVNGTLKWVKIPAGGLKGSFGGMNYTIHQPMPKKPKQRLKSP